MIVSVIGGTGPQGLGIALRLAIEGVEVIVGSRKEEKALDVVAEAKEKYADYDLNIKGILYRQDCIRCNCTFRNCNRWKTIQIRRLNGRIRSRKNCKNP